MEEIQMIQIPLDVDLKTAIKYLRKQYILLQMEPGESLKSVSERIGVTYRQARYCFDDVSRSKAIEDQKLRAEGRKKQRLILEQTKGNRCYFCGVPDNLHEHHVHGVQKDKFKIVRLCESCHKRFHVLGRYLIKE